MNMHLLAWLAMSLNENLNKYKLLLPRWTVARHGLQMDLNLAIYLVRGDTQPDYKWMVDLVISTHAKMAEDHQRCQDYIASGVVTTALCQAPRP